MCPLCDGVCDYWRLNTTCLHSKVSVPVGRARDWRFLPALTSFILRGFYDGVAFTVLPSI